MTLRWGIRVSLDAHPMSCSLDEVGALAAGLSRPLAVDLFCGAGGLSLGLEMAGFKVILAADSDEHAVATHRAHFGGCTVRTDLSRKAELLKLAHALSDVRVDLLAAGPPCQLFSRAGRGKLRSLRRDFADSGETVAELWMAVIELARLVRPRAVLVENVPGAVESENVRMVASLVRELEAIGFEVHTRLLAARDYGVPQHRERLFIVGVEPGSLFTWPQPSDRRITVRDAIGDLPPVRGGEREEWCRYDGPRSEFQHWARQGVPPEQADRVYDHYTRPVRDDDLIAFRLMDENTRYSDLPPSLRRYRADIFTDKYKRLSWDDVARTVTAHMAKDGYWYIHPDQHRTLTVREAARLQSFPDWFRFCGTPGQALRQIGNAVPPLLACALGKAIREALSRPKLGQTHGLRPELSDMLVRWITSLPEHELSAPWRRCGEVWPVLLGTLLFERSPRDVIADLWPMYNARWPTPESFLADSMAETAVLAIRSPKVLRQLRQLAQALQHDGRDNVAQRLRVDGLSRVRLSVTAALCGDARAAQLSAPLLRVLRRIRGCSSDLSRVEARLMLARLIGERSPGLVLAALLEVADQFCRTGDPNCHGCPLASGCKTQNSGADNSGRHQDSSRSMSF